MATKRKYVKQSCHGKKTDAKKAAEKLRAAGKTASVRKDTATGKHCVLSAGARKKAKRKSKK